MSESLLVVSGEISGDMHAGGLLAELKKLHPELHLFGIGGYASSEQGVALLQHVRDMSVFGPFAAIGKLWFFRKVFQRVLREVDQRRPRAALLVDYGGFNLRLAEALKKRGIPVLYFVSPQVWASRPGRIQTMSQVIDRLMVIFPFEPKVFEGTGLAVDYIGHPLVDAAAEVQAAPPTSLPWQGEFRVALLPGSRKQEIDLILPTLWQAAGLLEDLVPDVSFLIASPNPEITDSISRKLVNGMRGPSRYDIVTGDTRQVLKQATAAMVASGTATIEATLQHCPMVVVYKTSGLLYAIGKRIVKLPHIGMVNLVGGREICPEFIQNEATPKRLATAMLPLLSDTDQRRAMVSGLEAVVSRLGEPGPYRRAAAIVSEVLVS